MVPAIAQLAVSEVVEQSSPEVALESSTNTNNTQVASLNADLVKAGEKSFKKCKSCHQVGEGAKNKTGPHLNGIFGRAIGGMDGFKYSKVLTFYAGRRSGFGMKKPWLLF